jgi:hypothetical protein
MFLTWKPRTNTTSRRRLHWRRSSTTRRSLATASSISRSSPTWPHVSLCTTSGAATTWTRSRAAAPRCPSSSRGTSWSSPTSATLGLFRAPHPMTAPSRCPAYRPPKANLPRKSLLTGHNSCALGRRPLLTLCECP